MFNEQTLKGKWTEIKGEIRTQWGKLTENEVDQASGNLTSLAGIIQQRYGIKKEEAQEKLQKIAAKFVKVTEDVKEEARKKVS
jgi:uncharacterized protein YjbJ (UPF0337 family)